MLSPYIQLPIQSGANECPNEASSRTNRLSGAVLKSNCTKWHQRIYYSILPNHSTSHSVLSLELHFPLTLQFTRINRIKRAKYSRNPNDDVTKFVHRSINRLKLPPNSGQDINPLLARRVSQKKISPFIMYSLHCQNFVKSCPTACHIACDYRCFLSHWRRGNKIEE